MKNLLLLTLLFNLSSCVPLAKKVVGVITANILEPVSVTFSEPVDLGEQAVSLEPTTITMEITNNSSDEIRKLELIFGPGQTLLKFTEDLDSLVASPGYQGTCRDTLAPGAKCTYKINFTPRKVGIFSIPVTFNYENLIEPQTKSFTFTAVVGEPAALTFTNDISNYDFGVIEQTEATQRFIDLEIQNVGGLSARNVAVQADALNDNPNGAYSIVKNDCPAKIPGGVKCKIRLGYTPHNNNYSDNAITYTGKLSLEYLKDPKDNTGVLNAYSTFLSTTIEAKFKENFSAIEYPTLVAGNQDVKTIKITNNGYREGIMNEMYFYDASHTKIATCIKATTGLNLNCQKSLVNFPFIVEDSNSCFGKSVAGIVGKTPGEYCYFRITYWPSTTYQTGSQAAHNFNASTISLHYDSQWKGNVNWVSKDYMFNITADFLAAGKLVLDKVELDNIPLLTADIVAGANNVFEADMGRIALVSTSAYSTFVKITLKNTGENPVTFSSLKDGAISPHDITDIGYALNTYYQAIKHSNCTIVPPGGVCSLSYNLTPVFQGASPAQSLVQDGLMYDNVTNILRKYKKFIAKYSDGSTIEDTGLATTDRPLEVRLIAKLIQKGYLSIETPSYTFPAIVNGNSNVKNFYLKNVGTGDIYAVLKNVSKNLDPKTGQSNYPFKVLDLATPVGADKDCYDLLYPSTFTTANSLIQDPAFPLDPTKKIPDATKFLTPGQTCVLSVQNQATDVTRTIETDYTLPADEWRRLFKSSFNNTSDIWPRRQFNQANISVNFQYYDGDKNDAVPSSFPYGYMASTKDITIGSSFTTPANILVKDPLPSTSALFQRPAIIYPKLSITAPIAASIACVTTSVTNPAPNCKTIPETYLDSSYFTNTAANGFTKSIEAITHVKSLGLTGGSYESEYKYHAGTFPINQTTEFQFTFINESSQTGAANAVLSEGTQAANYPIQLSSYNNLPVTALTTRPLAAITIAPNQPVIIKFNFTPTAAGIYKRCYTLTYDSGIDSRNQYVCVYAEALAASPKIKIEYSDVTVTQTSTTTTSEAETGIFTTLATPMNSTDVTAPATFTGIKGGVTYAEKRIKITNIGNASATKFYFYYMSNPVLPATPATDTTISVKNNAGVSLTKPCTLNMTIAANDYCELYIKYKPTISSAATVSTYLGTIFDMGPSLNQYVSYVGALKFMALDPALLEMKVTGVTAEIVTDWSVPTTPVPLNTSWPVNLGSYGTATTPPHMLLAAPPTTKSIFNIEIINKSALKASFLNLNTPVAGGPMSGLTAIYSNTEVKIWASRYCFYGDDENNALIAAADKGFSSTVSAYGNKCLLQVDFSGFKAYESCSVWSAATKTKSMTLGQTVVGSCNPFVYKLTYWSYKRSSNSDLYVHMKGFIEPDRVAVTPAKVYNVSSVGGTVTFDWQPMTPLNPAWGAITKYRVYYDTSYSNLNTINVFKLTSPVLYKETAIATGTTPIPTTISVTGLTPGKYYFFKVFAVRTYTGVTPNLTFISNSNIPIVPVVIPTTTQLYNHTLGTLIDKAYKLPAGTLTNGVSACLKDVYSLSISGASKNVTKLLISTPVFNYLQSSSSLSTGYPTQGIGAIPHWLSDTAYNLRTSISLYNGAVLPGFPGFVTTKLSGNSPTNSLVYQKTCTNNASCDLLYKIVGGDGVDLYFQGTFYATPSVSAYYRCYATIPCPTSTGKLITDPSCPAM